MFVRSGMRVLAAASAGIIFLGWMCPGGFAQTPNAPVGEYRRGAEEIYMIKCWMCHNTYAKAGPPLSDLNKRPKLLSGEPVNAQTVSDKIKAGGERMPSYRHSLTDTQLSALVGYLLGGKCCPDPQNPPANPRFRNP